MLSCLLVMASLLNLSPASEELLSRTELELVRRARENAGVMLNRYLKLKVGPKKAETKVRRRGKRTIEHNQWITRRSDVLMITSGNTANNFTILLMIFSSSNRTQSLDNNMKTARSLFWP